MQGFRDCHVRDGVALVRYFAWLENELAQGAGDLREFEAASKLEEFRKCVSSSLFTSQSTSRRARPPRC